MIYIYRLRKGSSTYGNSWKERVSRPLSKIQVIDLTQGNRIFILEPDLIVEDAFIFEDDFWILGRECSEKSKTGLFKYDINHKTSQEKFFSANGTSLLDQFESEDFACGDFSFSFVGYEFVIRSCCYLLEQIWHVSDSYFILLRDETDFAFGSCKTEGFFLLALECTNTQKSLYTRKNICYVEVDQCAPSPFEILWCNDFILCTTRIYNKNELKLTKYDFATREAHMIEANASSYILVGDYFYKQVGSEWWKTNISNGVEDLQWEVFIQP